MTDDAASGVGPAGVAVLTAVLVAARLAVVTASASSAGTAFVEVAVEFNCVAVELASTVEVVEVDELAPSDVVAALTLENDEVDPFLTGVDVGCRLSGAESADVALAWLTWVVRAESSLDFGCTARGLVSFAASALDTEPTDDCGAIGLVRDPPLLLTVTPVPVCADEGVEPGVFGLPTAVLLPTDIDPALVDVEPTMPVVLDDEAPGIDVAADPEEALLDDVLLVVEPDELDGEDDPEDVPFVSATATAGDVVISTPIPRAAANPPTRPM